MEFKLKDARPIWQQLSEVLTERIVTGLYEPGSRFPTVRDLAAEAGVNPNTMQRAIAQLESDGLVLTNRTAGRTVTEDKAIPEEIRTVLAHRRVNNFLEDMEKIGYDIAQSAAMAAEGKKE